MFIVSFVNQILSPSLRLGLYDDNFNSFYYLDDFIENDSIGATGIDVDKNRKLVYVAYQSGGIAVFNRSMELVQYYENKKIKDPHSIKLVGKKLYVVSTGNNAIHEISINSKGHCSRLKTNWTYNNTSSSEDTVHMNSIIVDGDSKLVSIFGEKQKGDNWKKAKNGMIMSFENDEIVLDGLHGPHSLIKYKSKTYFCNSAQGEVMDLNGQVVYKTKGYLRGLEFYKNKMYVGKNKRRLLSKNFSKILRGRVSSFETDISNSEIDIIDLRTKKLVNSIPFEIYGREIYDIKHVAFKLSIKSKPPEALRLQKIENSFISKIKLIEEDFLLQKENEKKELIQRTKEMDLEKSEVTKLKMKIVEHNEKVKKIESLVSQVKGEKTELKQENEKVLSQLQFLENAIQKREYELSDKNNLLKIKENELLDHELKWKKKLIVFQNEKDKVVNNLLKIKEKELLDHELKWKKKLNGFQIEKDKLLNDLSKAKGEKTQLKQEQGKVNSQLKLLEKVIQESESELSDKNKLIKIKENELLDHELAWKKKLIDFQNEKDEVVNDLLKRKSKTENEAKLLFEKKSEIQDELKEQIKKYKKIEIRIKLLESINSKSEQDLASRNKYIHEIEQKLKVQDGIISKTEKELIAQHKFFMDLKQESKESSEVVFVQNQKLEAVGDSLKNEKQVNLIATEKLESLRLEFSKLQAGISKQIENYNVLERINSDNENQLQSRNAIIEKLKNEKVEHSNKIIKLSELNNKSNTEHLEELTNFSNKNNELIAKLKFFERLIEGHEGEIDSNNKVILKQKVELENSQKSISNYKSQTSVLSSDIKDIKKSYSWKLGYKITRMLMKLFGWTSFIKKRI